MYKQIAFISINYKLYTILLDHNVSGAVLGITDKMEARSPAPSPHSAGTDPGMKELGLVILTCLFLSSAELTEKEY